MRVYIAYKYTNISDKEKLKRDLNNISQIVASGGHKTFILGRDVQDWGNKKTSTFKKTLAILKNLFTADILLAFIENPEKSKGLAFEMSMAKFFGRYSALLIKTGLEQTYFRDLATEVFEFSNEGEIPYIISEKILKSQ